MSKPARVRVSGPLAGQVSGFWAELTGRGYTPWSATGQLRLLAHLGRWMAGEGLEPAQLTDLQVGRFCGRGGTPVTASWSPRGGLRRCWATCGRRVRSLSRHWP
jgi:hypothetical protein